MQEIFTFTRRGVGPERKSDRHIPAQRHTAEIHGKAPRCGNSPAAEMFEKTMEVS